MSSLPIDVEIRNAVGILTINRPERSNALARETVLLLGKETLGLIENPKIRAIVLTGSGEKVFCAGADLKERKDMSLDEVRKQLALYRSELQVLDRSPKPVIAALNGSALGGGLELALLCDLRVSVSKAEFSLPETSLGIIPGAGGTQKLRRIVGEARAKEMILLARRIQASQALEWGLINRICPENSNILEDTLLWIDPITNGAPIAQKAALQAIDASFDTKLEEGLSLELSFYEETLKSKDRLEALKAFSEKRRPLFSGE